MEKLRSGVRARELGRDSPPGAPGCLPLFTEVSFMSENTLSKVKLDRLFLVPSVLSPILLCSWGRFLSCQTLFLLARGRVRMAFVQWNFVFV